MFRKLLTRSDLRLIAFFEIFKYCAGELLYKKCIKMQTPITDEVKDYFHKSIRDGKQWESYIRLSEIYKNENNLPKAIEMLENLTQ